MQGRAANSYSEIRFGPLVRGLDAGSAAGEAGAGEKRLFSLPERRQRTQAVSGGVEAVTAPDPASGAATSPLEHPGRAAALVPQRRGEGRGKLPGQDSAGEGAGLSCVTAWSGRRTGEGRRGLGGPRGRAASLEVATPRASPAPAPLVARGQPGSTGAACTGARVAVFVNGPSFRPSERCLRVTGRDLGQRCLHLLWALHRDVGQRLGPRADVPSG